MTRTATGLVMLISLASPFATGCYAHDRLHDQDVYIDPPRRDYDERREHIEEHHDDHHQDRHDDHHDDHHGDHRENHHDDRK